MTTLKKYIAAQGITVTEMARKLGVSVGHIHNIYTGKRMPGLAVAVAIEQVTNGAVPVTTLVLPCAKRDFKAGAPASSVAFTVPDLPRGKARPRIGRHGGYTPATTRAYEAHVQANAIEAMQAIDRRQPMDGPLRLTLAAVLPIPQSWPRQKRDAAVGAWHAARPDLDNIVKAVLDGMAGTVFHDDAQIAAIDAIKTRGIHPRVSVQVTPV